MFESIGIAEMAVIAGIALIVLGPEKFPGHAKIALRFMRDIRTYWDEAKRDIAEELKPVKSELRDLQKYKAEDYLDALTDEKPPESSTNDAGTTYGEVTSEGTASSATTDPEPSQSVGRSEATPWQTVEGAEPFTVATTPDPEHPAEPDYVESPNPKSHYEDADGHQVPPD